MVVGASGPWLMPMIANSSPPCVGQSPFCAPDRNTRRNARGAVWPPAPSSTRHPVVIKPLSPSGPARDSQPPPGCHARASVGSLRREGQRPMTKRRLCALRVRSVHGTLTPIEPLSWVRPGRGAGHDRHLRSVHAGQSPFCARAGAQLRLS